MKRKQIDKEISECKEAIDYVKGQFSKTLGKIQVSVNKFSIDTDTAYPYQTTMNEIRVYADELEHLLETDRRNRYMLEILEEIKDEDYC